MCITETLKHRSQCPMKQSETYQSIDRSRGGVTLTLLRIVQGVFPRGKPAFPDLRWMFPNLK